MKTKLRFLNLLVVVSMVFMRISARCRCLRLPPHRLTRRPQQQPLGAIVSQPVSPAKTDGLPPAPTVNGARKEGV